MDRNTPRGMIRGILQSSGSSGGKETSQKRTPSLGIVGSPWTLRSSGSFSSSSTSKRPAHQPLYPAAKRSKSGFPTPNETITPRTTIKTLLKTADPETPVERAAGKPNEDGSGRLFAEMNTRQSVPRSAISDIQFERLVGSSSSMNFSTKKSSLGSVRRRSGRNQSISTPSETITPRANIKTFLKAAETERPTKRRNFPSNEDTTQPEKTGDSLLADRPLSDTDQEELDVSKAGDGLAGPEVSTESSDVTEMPGTSQSDVTYEMSDTSGRHHSISNASSGWSNLQTPVLPDETISKASPALPVKPPIAPQQQKPARNLKNTEMVRRPGGKVTTNDTSKSRPERFPQSLVKGIFSHFSTLKVSKDAFDAIQKGSDAFFKHLSSDLTTYCGHAKRKVIEQADVELLMRRQGLVTSKESFHALVEKYLPLEYRQEIIPSATAGNKVVPKLK